jgi:branched-chain amino acid transport system permease protein
MFGAAFLAYLNQEGLANIGHSLNQTFGTNLDVPLYQFGIYGAIIVAVMLIRPEGLIPSARRSAELHEGVHDTPLYDLEHE